MRPIVVDADAPGLAQAVDVVRRGGVLIHPTETVYGIGCSPFNASAVERVRRIKHREAARPMLAITNEWQRVLPWLGEVPGRLRLLMEIEPPLPLTLVFPASDAAPDALVSTDHTIAIRRTSDDVARHLATASNGVLLSTSANLAGGNPPDHFSTIDSNLLKEVDLAVDAGRTLAGRPSTIIGIRDGHVEILREGAMSRDEITRLIESP